MYKKACLILFTSIMISTTTAAKIRIILTTALSDWYYDLRKEQYIESFRLLKNHGYDNVYVVEALAKKGPTFLDDYSCNVFYSQANDPTILPGYNESRTLLDALYHFNFDPEDIIIKLTGRHHFVSDEFIKHVEAHPNIDLFAAIQNSKDIRSLAFAMRCKYLIEMCEWCNSVIPTLKNPQRTPLEMLYGSYIRPRVEKGLLKVEYVKKLGVHVRILGSTTAPHLADDTALR